MSDLNRIGELSKNASTKIVFSTTEYRDSMYVDMREYVESATYTGFTKKGIRLHADKLDEFIENLQRVRAALPAVSGEDAPAEEVLEQEPEPQADD